MADVLIRDATVGGRLQKAHRRVRSLRLPWIPLIVLGVLIVCAVFAPLLAPADPEHTDVFAARIPPFQMWEHPLGTDMLGRDMLSRLIYGARTSAFISLAALGFGAFVGSSLGILSGYVGGWMDDLIMRLADMVMGFPTILAALIIIAIIGVGIQNVLLAIMVTVWARFARQIRGEVMSVKEQDFVTIAKISGVAPLVIMWRHIFPNVVNTLLIIVSLLVGQVILMEASLSFLGLGVAPGAPAWGIMVSEGRIVLRDVWWLALFPGLAITFVVMSMNIFGDWLRDTLDPKLRRV